MPAAVCPCGTGRPYDGCCGPVHRGVAEAATAQELMRSRYAAYATGRVDHVFRTWHPRTRPDRVDVEPGVVWTGLEVLDTTDTEVAFVATYLHHGAPGELRERSRFERRRGRWVYVEAVDDVEDADDAEGDAGSTPSRSRTSS